MKNKLIYILDDLRVSAFQLIFISGWTIPLKNQSTDLKNLQGNLKNLLHWKLVLGTE